MSTFDEIKPIANTLEMRSHLLAWAIDVDKNNTLSNPDWFPTDAEKSIVKAINAYYSKYSKPTYLDHLRDTLAKDAHHEQIHNILNLVDANIDLMKADPIRIAHLEDSAYAWIRLQALKNAIIESTDAVKAGDIHKPLELITAASLLGRYSEDLIRMDEWLTELDPPRKALYQDIIYANTVNIHMGESKSFKTMFGLWQAINMALQNIPVLWLNCDMDTPMLRERVRAMQKHLKLPSNAPLYIETRRPFVLDEANLAWLLYICEEYGIEAIYIDCLAKIIGAANPDKAQDMEPFMTRLRLLADAGISSNIIHHTTRNSAHVRGSTVMEANADRIFMYRKNDKTKMTLTCPMTRIQDYDGSEWGWRPVKDLQGQLTSCSWVYSGAAKADPKTQSKEAQAIIAIPKIMDDEGGEADTPTILNGLKLEYNIGNVSGRRALKRLESDGTIRKPDKLGKDGRHIWKIVGHLDVIAIKELMDRLKEEKSSAV